MSVTYKDLTVEYLEEDSETIKKRVDSAREIQLGRFKGSNTFSNSKMTDQQIKKYCKLSETCNAILQVAFEKLKLSARAFNRILKVARTIDH